MLLLPRSHLSIWTPDNEHWSHILIKKKFYHGLQSSYFIDFFNTKFRLQCWLSCIVLRELRISHAQPAPAICFFPHDTLLRMNRRHWRSRKMQRCLHPETWKINNIPKLQILFMVEVRLKEKGKCWQKFGFTRIWPTYSNKQPAWNATQFLEAKHLAK